MTYTMINQSEIDSYLQRSARFIDKVRKLGDDVNAFVQNVVTDSHDTHTANQPTNTSIDESVQTSDVVDLDSLLMGINFDNEKQDLLF